MAALTTAPPGGLAGEAREAWPRVSVVVPVYNAEEWLGETLSTVTCQTYPVDQLELVVVDDGSTDGSAALAEHALAGAGIAHQVFRTSNGGPSRARNIGWRAACGEWIQFLDADDLLDRGKIRIQMAVAKTLPATVAVVYSTWQRLGLADGAWKPLGEPVMPRVGEDALADLLEPDGFLQTSCCVIRRTWLERVSGYDERHWLIEDVDLLLRLAMAGGEFHLVGVGVPLSVYRQGTRGSLSRRDASEFLEGCVRNARMVEAWWRRRGEVTPRRARLLADVYCQAARHFAAAEPRRFEELVARIDALGPGYAPAGPPALRALSRLIGYRRAERAAVAYRRAKRRLGRGA